MEDWARAKWQAHTSIPWSTVLFCFFYWRIFYFQQNHLHSEWIVYCARLTAGPEVISTAH